MVCYLQYLVSGDGVHTDPDKISALISWLVPKTLKEFHSFLGFAGYYLCFLKDYSRIVRLLNDLTAGYPPLSKGPRTKTDNPNSIGILRNFLVIVGQPPVGMLLS